MEIRCIGAGCVTGGAEQGKFPERNPKREYLPRGISLE